MRAGSLFLRVQGKYRERQEEFSGVLFDWDMPVGTSNILRTGHKCFAGVQHGDHLLVVDDFGGFDQCLRLDGAGCCPAASYFGGCWGGILGLGACCIRTPQLLSLVAADVVVGEFEVGGGGGFGHVTGKAVAWFRCVRGLVALPALFAVEGWVGAEGVCVGRVAGGAGDLPFGVAGAFDQAEGLETDVQGIIGFARRGEAMAFGALFERRFAGWLGGVIGGVGVAVPAGEAGRAFAVAGEALADSGFRLGDAEGVFG